MSKKKKKNKYKSKDAVVTLANYRPVKYRYHQIPTDDVIDGFTFRPMLAHSQVEGEKVCIRVYHPYIQVKEGVILAKDHTGVLIDLKEVVE